ncbi:hypothetical protein BSLG_002398 [Batrachochytrium salamandrivorans]|nr:hypothetical protein BSLG_002398 [Batrachochytrium salamandrivorans]
MKFSNYVWGALSSLGFVALSEAYTSHQISITMVVDNFYELTLDGDVIPGPVTTSSQFSWQIVNTYTKVVTNDGPWLIAINGTDIGVIAGLFAVVSLDGVPYAATGTPNSEFVMSPTVDDPSWNTDVYYDDSTWVTQTTDTCSNYASTWTSLLQNFSTTSGGQVAYPM